MHFDQRHPYFFEFLHVFHNVQVCHRYHNEQERLNMPLYIILIVVILDGYRLGVDEQKQSQTESALRPVSSVWIYAHSFPLPLIKICSATFVMEIKAA
jgi:hypothetical protein